MNPRFDCFVWNNWNAICLTVERVCLTALYVEKATSEADRCDIGVCLTGTGVLSNRCPRGAGACVSANLGRRARCRALCGQGRARRRSGVAA